MRPIERLAVARKRGRALDLVAKLTDVPGPVVAYEGFERCRMDAGDAPPVPLASGGHEALGEQRDVLAPGPQRWELDRERDEPVVQVLTKTALGDLGREVPVGCGDDAHVDLARSRVAHGHDLALLEYAQELCLHRARHLGDLVEEDGAFLGRLEEAAAVVDRARERPAA